MSFDHPVELIGNSHEKAGEVGGDQGVQSEEENHEQERYAAAAPGHLHHEYPHDYSHRNIGPTSLNHIPRMGREV